MAAEEELQDAALKKKSKLPLILGLVLFLALGGGGFYAVFSGLILGHGSETATNGTTAEALPEIAFLPVDAITVTLGEGENERHLRFISQVEVAKEYDDEVTLLMPRILDVLNGYLRAVDPAELKVPSALVRVRAQMLRRIQIVTGEGRVRDLLITEYLLN